MITERPSKWERDKCTVYEREMMYQASNATAKRGGVWPLVPIGVLLLLAVVQIAEALDAIAKVMAQ